MSELRAARRRRVKLVAVPAAVIALVVAMALDTKFISAAELETYTGVQFSAEEFARQNFDAITAAVTEKAQPAAALRQAIEADKDAAGEQFGGRDSAGAAWAFPVTLTGAAGQVNTVNGQLPVTVEGFPEAPQLLVQTGPAVIGSALRDVTGEITFGMFLNQTEYQQAGQALNDVVRAQVLPGVDAAALDGRTVTVVGAFLLDAQSGGRWLITPVSIAVEG
ncbi:MAG: DUF2291 domain-containing protein [Bifidobacteriaceae bacterium]|jgi:predicted lipoprotein|nr:DUF2291 domain-containing protein [Bifidobacteriaceae bacterium]